MNQKENKKGCHPEEFLFRISSLLINNTKAGGPEQKHLRTTHCAAFTLIELLVVVLIIGILSAVALPQYEKAVEKSRASQALIVLKSIWEAQQTFYLSNGIYAKSFEELDIDIPSWTENIKWSTYNPQIATQSNKDWSLQIDSYYLMLGRVSGSYAGAGFIIDMNNGEILCAERTNSAGFVYQKEAGSYCQKLFRGTPVESGFSTLRAYKMP